MCVSPLILIPVCSKSSEDIKESDYVRVFP